MSNSHLIDLLVDFSSHEHFFTHDCHQYCFRTLSLNELRAYEGEPLNLSSDPIPSIYHSDLTWTPSFGLIDENETVIGLLQLKLESVSIHEGSESCLTLELIHLYENLRGFGIASAWVEAFSESFLEAIESWLVDDIHHESAMTFYAKYISSEGRYMGNKLFDCLDTFLSQKTIWAAHDQSN